MAKSEGIDQKALAKLTENIFKKELPKWNADEIQQLTRRVQAL